MSKRRRNDYSTNDIFLRTKAEFSDNLRPKCLVKGLEGYCDNRFNYAVCVSHGKI